MLHVMFNVDCNPVGKQRPRFRRVGNFVQTYSPKKTVDLESQIRKAAEKAMGGMEPLETPIALYCYIKFPIPKSYTKKRQEQCKLGLEKPIKKPDLDNIIKLIQDSLNGVVYKDDCQIVALHSTKVYGSAGLEILVKEELW